MKIAITTDTHYCKSTHSTSRYMLEHIKKFNPEILIHCGDVSSSNYPEQEAFWKLTRETLGLDVKIVTVMGNHDWWDRYYDDEDTSKIIRPSNPEQLFSLVKEVYCKYNIHHASENLVFDQIAISGYDGWYGDKEVPHKATRDSKVIPHYYGEGETWLYNRNFKDFDNAIAFLNSKKAENKKTFLVTHFGITPECADDWKSKIGKEYFGNNPRFSQFIENVDYLCYGHSHQEVDFIFKTTRVLNSGSDYYFPKYITLDI